MIGMTLVTKQTGAEGKLVRKVYVEAGSEIEKEYYLALMVERESASIAIMFSTEGGMDINNHKLRRFKNGAFKLAIDNQVPLVPITFLNNWRLFSDHTDLLGSGSPGIAKIKIHKAIGPDSESYKDVVSLREKTYSIIEKALKGYENRR